jgi:hypothetical protein
VAVYRSDGHVARIEAQWDVELETKKPPQVGGFGVGFKPDLRERSNCSLLRRKAD